MQKPDRPVDESSRLESLASLNILDTPPEERFDRLVRMAKRIFDVPIALVSLVDEPASGSSRLWRRCWQSYSSSWTFTFIAFRR
jgi:hypothetical protein